MAAQSAVARQRWRPGPCSVSPVALVALAVAGPLAEALVIPAEALAAGVAAGVAAGGVAAAVLAAGAATGAAAGGAAGSRGAAALRGPPVVPAGAAGVVGGGGNAGRRRRGGKGCGRCYC
jgi:hypothetical protein